VFLIFVFATFYALSIVPRISNASESAECAFENVNWSVDPSGNWTAGGVFGSPEIPVTRLPLCSSANTSNLGFAIPSLGDILTFFIRAFFAIAGISALFYLLLGAFAWITSGGDKDSIKATREKIQAAIIGLILIVAVLALIWTLEQVVFAKRICLGVSCPVTIPGLIKPNTGTPPNSVCCTCSNGTDIVNLSTGEACP
jgi:hypothetical protein